MGENQSIEKFKVLYVVKSFKQIEGFEYSETFAPSSKLETMESTVRAWSAEKRNYPQSNGCKVRVFASINQGKEISSATNKLRKTR